MNIVITGGPTNEPIDKVMKITNMSTGGLAVSMAYDAAKHGHTVTAILNYSVKADMLYGLDNVSVLRVETTDDLMQALQEVSGPNIDIVIHSAAVADYAPEFTFRMEDMAFEIASEVSGSRDLSETELSQKILEIMKNPICKVYDESKISSYEQNLTVKLGLTPKVISNLRAWFPNAKLYGFKLLENVPRNKLIDVATKLCIKNNMDGIFANDLSILRKGHPTRLVINKDGWNGVELNGAEEIIDFVLNDGGDK